MSLAYVLFVMVGITVNVFRPTDAVVCQTGTTIEINGGGSPIAETFIGEVAAEYALNRTLTTGRTLNMNYDFKDSQYGMDRLRGVNPSLGFVMYATGESFFPYDQNIYPGVVYLMPILGEGMSIIFSLPGITSITLSMPVLAGIYMGQIIHWNDTTIQNLNPGIALPGNEIVVTARADPAAHTRILTSSFCKYNENWCSLYKEFNDPGFVDGKCCNSTNWPPGIIKYFANKDYGMVNLGATISYMIGYLAQPYAITYGLTSAAVVNRAGYPINCTSEAMIEGMTYWTGKNPNSTMFRLIDAPTPGAYPLLSFYYLAVDFETMSNFSCCQQEELIGFLDYLAFMPQNKQRAINYYFVPVFDNISGNVAQQILYKAMCSGESLYTAFLATIHNESGLPSFVIGIIAAACVVIVVLALVIGFVWRDRTMTDERNWLIQSRFLDLDALVAAHSMSSMYSDSSKSHDEISSEKSSTKNQKNQSNQMQYPLSKTSMDDKPVMLLELDVKLPKHWRKETRMLMFRYCQRLSHTGVAHLFGITVIGTKVFAVQEFLHKGSLHYVLQTSRFEFSDAIKISIASDVAEAVSYLHSRTIVIGQLNSLSCFVTSNWSIKVANWMSCSVIAREDPTYIDYLYRFDKESLKDEKRLIELLYLHSDAPKTGKFTVQSDIFSFALLLSEVINRSTPYSQEVSMKKTSYYQILKNKIELQMAPVPEIATPNANRLLEKLCVSCLAEKYSSFVTIATELHTEQYHGGVTDILMETMETMISDMEKRSLELQKVSTKMRELLSEVLPPTIAEKMFHNQVVEPEYFESVSVFFSDIVGFTQIAAKSSPLEVMAFLNDLWIMFDSVIERYDCYKIDTINDAYMVCSGLPTRNGISHAKHIADLSITLKNQTANFVIKHMPGESLVIRVGLNSGAVTTGVVGTKMPQFCVFGDTVNTAARMEQTGLPGKVQASDATAKLLMTHFPQYKLERRGDVEVKGKGLMTTYWLDESSTLQKMRNMAGITAAD